MCAFILKVLDLDFLWSVKFIQLSNVTENIYKYLIIYEQLKFCYWFQNSSDDRHNEKYFDLGPTSSL